MFRFNLSRDSYKANRIYCDSSLIYIDGDIIKFVAPKVECANVPKSTNEIANKKYVDDSKISSIKLDRSNNKLIFINNAGVQIKVDATQLLYRADESTISLNKETNEFSISQAFQAQLNNITGNINNLNSHIDSIVPPQATADNQLADKDFVNSSIANSTATFRGTYTSIDAFPSIGIDGNDYVFLDTVDELGNRKFDRYKYTNGAWAYEYTLNNSSFTEAQWKAINSGITTDYLSTLATKEYVDNLIQQEIIDALEGDY